MVAIVIFDISSCHTHCIVKPQTANLQFSQSYKSLEMKFFLDRITDLPLIESNSGVSGNYVLKNNEITPRFPIIAVIVRNSVPRLYITQ